MRSLTITYTASKCQSGKCPFYERDDGGGHCDGWNFCGRTGKEIEMWRYKGEDFPPFCPLKEV